MFSSHRFSTMTLLCCTANRASSVEKEVNFSLGCQYSISYWGRFPKGTSILSLKKLGMSFKGRFCNPGLLRTWTLLVFPKWEFNLSTVYWQAKEAVSVHKEWQQGHVFLMTGRETDVPNCKAGSCLALSVTHGNCSLCGNEEESSSKRWKAKV